MQTVERKPDVSRLRVFRTAAGLSQSALASRCGLSRAAISNLERGESSPLPVTARALAEALGIEAAELFPEEERRGG